MPMDIDQDKMDQAVLALLSLGRHETRSRSCPRRKDCGNRNAKPAQAIAPSCNRLLIASFFAIFSTPEGDSNGL